MRQRRSRRRRGAPPLLRGHSRPLQHGLRRRPRHRWLPQCLAGPAWLWSPSPWATRTRTTTPRRCPPARRRDARWRTLYARPQRPPLLQELEQEEQTQTRVCWRPDSLPSGGARRQWRRSASASRSNCSATRPLSPPAPLHPPPRRPHKGSADTRWRWPKRPLAPREGLLQQQVRRAARVHVVGVFAVRVRVVLVVVVRVAALVRTTATAAPTPTAAANGFGSRYASC